MQEEKISHRDQTIYERAELGERVITELRRLIKDRSIEVLGHLEMTAVCCSGGTVAIVKVDLDRLILPKK